jgi:phosphate starvation-inducible membrane PsiE
MFLYHETKTFVFAIFFAEKNKGDWTVTKTIIIFFITPPSDLYCMCVACH